jgi:hypothetical protein
MISYMYCICVSTKLIWLISLRQDITHFLKRDGDILLSTIEWRKPIARKRSKKNSKGF